MRPDVKLRAPAPYIVSRRKGCGHGGTGHAPMSGAAIFSTPASAVRLPNEHTGHDVLLRARVAAARRHPSAVHQGRSSDDSGCWREARYSLTLLIAADREKFDRATWT